MQRKMLPACFLTLAALAAAAGAYASLTSGGPRMGPQITVKRPAFHGYYDVKGVKTRIRAEPRF
jgi:hypothetical protein